MYLSEGEGCPTTLGLSQQTVGKETIAFGLYFASVFPSSDILNGYVTNIFPCSVMVTELPTYPLAKLMKHFVAAQWVRMCYISIIKITSYSIIIVFNI